MLSMLSSPIVLAPNGFGGKFDSASRNDGTPGSSAPEPLPEFTARIPTMMIGTMRPSVGEVPFCCWDCAPLLPLDAPVPVVGVPNLNMRKKFRGTWPAVPLGPDPSLGDCPPCLNAEASLPLSRDRRNPSKVPSSPSAVRLLASDMACSLPSSKVAAVAAAATDSNLDSNAVLSSPCRTGDRLLLSIVFPPPTPRLCLRPGNLSVKLFGRRRLDLLDGDLGKVGPLTEVVRLEKSMSRSGT